MTDFNVNLNQTNNVIPDPQLTDVTTKETSDVTASGNYGSSEAVTLEAEACTVRYEYSAQLVTDPEIPDPNANNNADSWNSVFEHLPNQKQLTDIFAVLMLIHDVAKEGRKSQRELAQAQADSVFNTNMEAAQKIRDAAALALVGAIVCGVAQIGAGLVSVGQGCKMMSMNAKMQTKGPDGEELTPNQQAQNTKLQTQINAVGAKYQGWSGVLTGSGNLTKGILDFFAQQHTAEQKEKEAYAGKEEAMRQQTKDDQQAYVKLDEAVREALQTIIQGYDQALKKIWS